MATSGTDNFSVSRNDIILAAYRKLGIGLRGESVDSDDIDDATQALNVMVKAWQTDGLQLWAQKRATLLLAKGQRVYNLSLTGDHATESYTESAVKVAGVTADTLLDVDSTAGMLVNDNIGVILNDGTLQWTTVKTIVDTDTVELNTALTFEAQIGNAVYVYTKKISRPLRIKEAFLRSADDGDIEVQILSEDEYTLLGNKTSEGRSVELFYKPLLNFGELKLFPVPDDVTDSLEIVYHRPFEDFNAATDTPDFPQEWYEAIIYGLAERLAPENGLPIADQNNIIKLAMIYKDRVMGWDVEDTSMYLMEERR